MYNWLNSETPIEEVPMLSPFLLLLLLLLSHLKTQATLPLGTPNFYHTSMVTLEAKPKTQKPKSQISCFNGTMNIKLLTLGPQNFYHASMVTLEATPKT